MSVLLASCRQKLGDVERVGVIRVTHGFGQADRVVRELGRVLEAAQHGVGDRHDDHRRHQQQDAVADDRRDERPAGRRPGPAVALRPPSAGRRVVPGAAIGVVMRYSPPVVSAPSMSRRSTQRW